MWVCENIHMYGYICADVYIQLDRYPAQLSRCWPHPHPSLSRKDLAEPRTWGKHSQQLTLKAKPAKLSRQLIP